MKECAKTFILGLGHQKCGTSWVYNYLSESPNFCKGTIKEFHIWDAIDIPLLKQNSAHKVGFNSNPVQFIRHAMQNNHGVYLDYFASLYSSQYSIAADITPSYCGLEASRLDAIKKEFQKRGIQVKALILIRDPLSRIKSAVRFNLDRKNYNEGIGSGDQEYSKALEKYYKNEHCTLRTNYEAIISQSKQVVAKEELHIGIYENMFTHSEVLRLSTFLGVELNAQYASVKVNKTIGIAEESTIDAQIKAHCADIYDFCFGAYPITQKLWGGSS